MLSQRALGSLWSYSFVTVRLRVPSHRPRGEADLQVGCEHEEEAEGPAPHRGPPLAADLESQLPRPPALPACGLLSDARCADACESGHVAHGKGGLLFSQNLALLPELSAPLPNLPLLRP